MVTTFGQLTNGALFGYGKSPYIFKKINDVTASATALGATRQIFNFPPNAEVRVSVISQADSWMVKWMVKEKLNVD